MGVIDKVAPIKKDVDQDIYNVARHRLQKMIIKNKLTESTGKFKDLWKAIKSLGLPNKVSYCKVKALKINNTVEHN